MYYNKTNRKTLKKHYTLSNWMTMVIKFAVVLIIAVAFTALICIIFRLLKRTYLTIPVGLMVILSIKNKLFGIFGISFSNAKVVRNFGSYSRDTNSESETYWITQFENTFRLIIPERNVGNIYHSLKFNQTYALADDFDLETKYRAGERVELKLELVYEQYYEVNVGSDKAVQIGSDSSYVYFAFIMPEGDAQVQIKEVSVEIPSAP